MDGLDDLGAGLAIDPGMVELDVKREAALGLPERPAAVQRT
jgi:hypothetical protein